MSGRAGHRFQAEEQLALLSAGTSARRMAARPLASRLGALVDWGALSEMLNARRLLPTLGPRVLELTGGDPAGEFAEALERALAAGRRQGALLVLVAARVQAKLAEAGIRCTPLKGPHLSEVLYGDPGRRLAADVDLLVATDELGTAVTVVRELGYAAPTDHVDEHGLPSLHFALAHEHGELPPVELHWRIHCYEARFAQERLLAPVGELSGDWHPAPIDDLAALLLLYARDGFMSLRLATDIGAWWDVFGAGLEPNALDEPMLAYPALERVLLAAVSVAKKTVGLPAEQITQRSASIDLRGRIAARLANPHPRVSEPQIYADMGLIDGLLTPPGGLWAFARRQVIPPREVLREYAPESVEGWGESYPLGHAMRVLGRYGLAMIRLFRAPADVQFQ
jgi:Uncharacterised nucleotidyltransferase